ncbi:MAG: hypothetical protein H0U95_05045 [Bacteroidetes bacterium]|nr:hypothetical protein [Bacteroidota bacterium]
MSKKKSKQSKGKSKVTAKSKLAALLGRSETKGKIGASLLETTKDLVAGAVVGGAAGGAIGKPSLLVGIGTTLVGHYVNVPMVTNLGLGMMASGSYQIGSDLMNGVSGVNGMKERLKTFGENLKSRLYLDKLIKSKKTTTNDGTNGMGNVQYFNYPNDQTQELDMGSLDNIEQEIARLGEHYERKQMSGMSDDVAGIDDDKIY